MLSGPMRSSSNGYFFFFLVVFFAFFAFFAFLAMLPSVIQKLAQCKSTIDMHTEYTTIAKLILCASKRVNDRHNLRPDEASRAAWTQLALPDQDGKKFSCGPKKPTTVESSGPWLVRPHDGPAIVKTRSHRLERGSMISRGH